MQTGDEREQDEQVFANTCDDASSFDCGRRIYRIGDWAILSLGGIRSPIYTVVRISRLQSSVESTFVITRENFKNLADIVFVTRSYS